MDCAAGSRVCIHGLGACHVFGGGASFLWVILNRYKYSTSVKQIFIIVTETILFMFPFIIFAEIYNAVLLITVSNFFPIKTVVVAVQAYFCAALSEETLKYIIVRRHLFSSRAVDASSVVVYGFAAGFGFAFLENVDYVLDPINHRGTRTDVMSYSDEWKSPMTERSIQTALIRIVLCIPLHTVCGVMTATELGRSTDDL